MRIALGVHKVSADLQTNIRTLARMTAEAAADSAGMVLFSEAAMSGFVGTGDPNHDRDLADFIPGRTTASLAATANRLAISIVFGMYERDQAGRLYDAGVLIGPDGTIQLHYRRNSPQWHQPDLVPLIYCQGTDIPLTRTRFGRTCMLLCGDLFDDMIMSRVAAMQPDLLLLPFAREFDSDVADEAAWTTTEIGIYARQAALSGATTALVNQIGPGGTIRKHFGAALVVDPHATVLTSLDLNTEGLLHQDFQQSHVRMWHKQSSQ